jgi:undecaprenyl-diphosphatase
VDIFQTIILSIIEGITEFLPVSSTGHLILASQILQIPETDFIKSFEIFIQLGAILAVFVLYFKNVWERKSIWKNIIIAFLPTAAIGLVLYKFVKSYLLGNSMVVVLSLLIGGLILILFEKTIHKKAVTVKKIEELSIMDSFWIGIAQSVSIIPGVSRSASTIIGGMLVGASREVAVEFSFILAIPTMAAAVGLDLVKSSWSFTPDQMITLAIGFIVSFITALIVVRWFITFVKQNSFVSFGVYRVVAALLFWYFIIYNH